jgi:hypothetical protein
MLKNEKDLDEFLAERASRSASRKAKARSSNGKPARRKATAPR